MFSSHMLYSKFFPISHSLLMSQRSQVLGLGGLPEKHAEGKLLSSSNIVSESEIWEDLDICILDIHIIPSIASAKSLLRNSGLGKLQLCCCRIRATGLPTYIRAKLQQSLHIPKAGELVTSQGSLPMRNTPPHHCLQEASLSVPLLLCVKSVSWLYLGVPPKAQ